MTILSCVLMTDWQSIPYDPCTELSPFHHPDIVSNYSAVELPKRLAKVEPIKRVANCVKMHQNNFDHVHVYVNVVHQMPVNAGGLTCIKVGSCGQYCDDKFGQCLYYILDPYLCIQVENTGGSTGSPTDHDLHSHKTLYEASNFLCKGGFSGQSFNSMCVTIYQETEHLYEDLVSEPVTKSLHTVHSQALQMLKLDVYTVAVNKCETTNVQGHHCYWIPNSIITNRHCSDCPPICRSLQRSLTFAQFCIGAALLMVSIPIAWVPVAALISDRVHREAQVSLNI